MFASKNFAVLLLRCPSFWARTERYLLVVIVHT
jgi:hypothetical protein